MNSVTQRFLRYVAINSQSNDSSNEIPSSSGQWTLANLLAKELKELGLVDVVVTPNCFVHATLPATASDLGPIIGLVAYLDTSPRFNGSNIKPQIHYNYAGDTIYLDEEKKMLLSPLMFPELLNYLDHDIITTDGTSLLGANGKAGIAEIMTALETIISNPDIQHSEIRIVFTPDQETKSKGIKNIDLKLFPVDFAITLDGDSLGEINFENFNAAHAVISINGRPAFIGDAKNKLINAGRIAAEWISHLPTNEIPEKTDGYDGFFHIDQLIGSVQKAEIYCLIRDFELDEFMRRKALMHKITNQINQKYGEGIASLVIQDDYYNMRSALESKPQLISLIINAVESSGVTPKISPIRGGSDGALLASMGIPAPNLFAGAHNCHSPYEFISIQAMEIAVKSLVNLISSSVI